MSIFSGLPRLSGRYTPKCKPYFDAIHSSLRHYDTLLNPNGMGVYLASIPKGMKLYHGTLRPDHVQGL
ncbi:hypothetical protein BDV33DRAFT_164164 [Aspergillus novoparasiticus]|uniref:Uncharacterized protein n=1 Tax=Aspergillus novoparasiticus TaxID=986946 RepID=A0A5N6F648_9EURO|nr:hypothetical protein BDV33DRAFT_164164 [Aspergillus novoparasiticus]